MIVGLKAAIMLPIVISLFFAIVNYIHSVYLYATALLFMLIRYIYKIRMQSKLQRFLHSIAETEYKTSIGKDINNKSFSSSVRRLCSQSHRKLLKVWCQGYWRDHLFLRDSIHVETFIFLTVGSIFFLRPEMVLFSEEYLSFLIGTTLLLFDVVFQGVFSGFDIGLPKPISHQNTVEYLLLSYLAISMIYNFGSELSKRYAIWNSTEYWFIGNYNGLHEFVDTCLDFHIKWFGVYLVYDFGRADEFGSHLSQRIDTNQIELRAESEENEVNQYFLTQREGIGNDSL